MSRILSRLFLVSLGLLLVISCGVVGCEEEEVVVEKVLVAPEIEISGVTKEKTTDFSEGAFSGLLEAMGAAAAYGMQLTIRSATMEMAFKIVNPNDFDIAVNSMMLTVTIDDTIIDKPNVTDKLYVPANETIYFSRVFAFKPYDVVTYLVPFEGMDGATASGIAGAVWANVIGGTATWEVHCLASISSEYGDTIEIYGLSWTKPAS